MYLYTWNYDICTWNRFWWWFYKNLAGELAKLCLALCSLNLNKIFQKYCKTFGIVLTEILQKYNICNCVCKNIAQYLQLYLQKYCKNIWESDHLDRHQSSEGEEWWPRVLLPQLSWIPMWSMRPFTHRSSIFWNYFWFLIVWYYFALKYQLSWIPMWKMRPFTHRSSIFWNYLVVLVKIKHDKLYWLQLYL